jgi:DNA-binding ferritin-like protein (Dps family)
MKTTKLAVLTAVILFGLTFSSCKNCNGNKGKDNGKDNRVTDTDKNRGKNQDKGQEDARAIELELRKRLERIAEAAGERSVEAVVYRSVVNGMEMSTVENVVLKWEDVLRAAAVNETYRRRFRDTFKERVSKELREKVKEAVRGAVLAEGEPRLVEWADKVKDKQKEGFEAEVAVETVGKNMGFNQVMVWVDMHVYVVDAEASKLFSGIIRKSYKWAVERSVAKVEGVDVAAEADVKVNVKLKKSWQDKVKAKVVAWVEFGMD